MMSKSKRKSQKNQPSGDFNFCPLCQLPLHFLKITGDTHLIRCEKNSWDQAKECQLGIECLNSDFHHYWDFTHFKLAEHRSLNLNLIKTEEKGNQNKKNEKKNTKRKHKVLSDTETSEEEFENLQRGKRKSKNKNTKTLIPSKTSQNKNKETMKKKINQTNQVTIFDSDDSDFEMFSKDNQKGKSYSKIFNKSFSQNDGSEFFPNETKSDSFTHFLVSGSQEIFSCEKNDELTSDCNTHKFNESAHCNTIDNNKNELHTEENNFKTDDNKSLISNLSEIIMDFKPTKYLMQELSESVINPNKYLEDIKSNLVREERNQSEDGTTNLYQNFEQEMFTPNKEELEVFTKNKEEQKMFTTNKEEYGETEVYLNKYCEQGMSTPIKDLEKSPCIQFSDSSDENYEVNSETGEILFTENFEAKEPRNTSNNIKQSEKHDLNEFETNEDVVKVGKHIKSIEQWKKILNKKQIEKTTKHQNKQQEVSLRNNPLQTPFYKLIPDTDFVVDGFKNGPIPNKNNYFLSHFHYDHYIGLNKHFNKIIHCSAITKDLLISIIKINEQLIRVINVNEIKVINQVEVTALEANHCPGALMFVFKTLHGNSYLHTGDFRADVSTMGKIDILKNTYFDKVYLDTTYCNPQYTFPPQNHVLDKMVKLIEQNHKKHPNTLYVCGSYTIGKEKVYISILEKMKWKVYVEQYKRKILKIINNKVINAHMVDNPTNAKVHVIGMTKLNNIHHLITYYETYKKKFNRLVAIKPTGWVYSEKSHEHINIKEISENIRIYEISYSEHSSFDELCQFVRLIRYKQIVSTVNPRNNENQVKLLQSYSKRKSITQGELGKYFQKE